MVAGDWIEPLLKSNFCSAFFVNGIVFFPVLQVKVMKEAPVPAPIPATRPAPAARPAPPKPEKQSPAPPAPAPVADATPFSSNAESSNTHEPEGIFYNPML